MNGSLCKLVAQYWYCTQAAYGSHIYYTYRVCIVWQAPAFGWIETLLKKAVMN